ncbi:MAG: hypothetical protein J5985_08795 [Kiritimatiellae bacterium]|nr:hypothetical protein [Kiritimatiellia bacterium]
MKKRIFPLTAAFAGVLLAGGCASTKNRLANYSQAVSLGQYERAEQIAAEKEKDGDDGLCWKLHKGSALVLQTKFADAMTTLDAAEEGFLEIDQAAALKRGYDRSISVLSNDRFLPYSGTGQERIFCSLYKGLSCAALGNHDGARVELNRANEWQNSYLADRQREIANYEEQLAGESNGRKAARKDEIASTILRSPELGQSLQSSCGYMHDVSLSQGDVLASLAKADYYNTYAQHVRGVFRWLNGDNARNDLRGTYEMLPSSALASRDFAEYEAGTKPRGQAWIYVEDGLCPMRDQTVIHLPLGLLPWVRRYVLYTGIALPKLVYRPYASSQYSVHASGGSLALEPIMDTDRLCKAEFDVAFRGVLQREILRFSIKTALQVAAGVVAQNASHSKGGSILAASMFLVQAGAAGWTAATVGADLRSWTGLPKRVFCQRVAFTPGETVTLQADARAIPIPMPSCENVVVVVRYPAQLSAPSISFITFNPQE